MQGDAYMLSEIEFRVVRAAAVDAVAPGMALGLSAAGDPMVLDGRTFDALVSHGLIDAAGHCTQAGLDALAPYKVDNAVILAAGLSTRFAPISYKKPKGVLEVHGEVLIERQIRQLHDAGIDDVTIVVGYMKEYFFYLEDEYDVRIVVNPDFAARNNHASLNVARDLLANTYVCVSDNYFSENPFHAYERHAYYAAQRATGATEEWCASIDDDGRIVDVAVGGRDAWVMVGQAYFDRAFSERFAPLIEKATACPDDVDALWEDVFAAHLDELDMHLVPYAPGTIFEFDSIDELRAFDPQFITNVDSDALVHITHTLGCGIEDVYDFYPLSEGLTNLSCHFRVKDGAEGAGEYVYRNPGVGTEDLIDRASEMEAQMLARDLGLDETFVYEDPDAGWKISRFIPDCRPLNAHDPVELSRAMAYARDLHAADGRLARSFDYYDEGCRYIELIQAKRCIDIPRFWDMADRARKVRAYARADGGEPCVTHNDFFELNFLVGADDALYLIEWEYAGMGDYANDLGTFTVCSKLSHDEFVAALEAYFGHEPTLAEKRHVAAFVGLAGWCWSVWSIYKEFEGENVGEWSYVYRSYAKEYLARALEWYEGDEA